MDGLEEGFELIGADEIEGAKCLLDALPFPVMLIAEDYQVEWQNRSARSTYGIDRGACYEISHGQKSPCDQHGEACPKRDALVQMKSSTVYHAHGTLEQSELFKVIAIPLAGARIIELHIPLDDKVTRDELTQMYTRAFFEQTTGRQLALLERIEQPYSLLILDLDHFKSINDTWGHLAGDAVLREAARTICSSIRESDTAGRWGGEEFIVFLPGTDLKGAAVQAERIRAAVEALVVDAAGTKINVTVSIGACSADPTRPILESYEDADKALYRAKRSGRNCVACG